MKNVFGKYRIATPVTTKLSNPAYHARPMAVSTWNSVVKVYNAHILRSQQAQQEFQRKMEAFARLEHPYILSIIEYGIEKGVPYSVMEYMERGSLRDRLNQIFPSRLSPQEAMKVISQIGLALQYAHGHHILHGNIKPENILFNENGDALLADFRLPDSEVDEDSRLDDEQVYYPLSETLSEKSDQYALGYLTYELFSGQMPSTKHPAVLVSTQQSSEETSTPEDHRSAAELLNRAKTVLLKAMAKEPGERYENVAAFLEALGEVFAVQSTASLSSAIDLVETAPMVELLETPPIAEPVEASPMANLVETPPMAEVAELLETPPIAEPVEASTVADLVETAPMADLSDPAEADWEDTSLPLPSAFHESSKTGVQRAAVIYQETWPFPAFLQRKTHRLSRRNIVLWPLVIIVPLLIVGAVYTGFFLQTSPIRLSKPLNGSPVSTSQALGGTVTVTTVTPPGTGLAQPDPSPTLSVNGIAPTSLAISPNATSSSASASDTTSSTEGNSSSSSGSDGSSGSSSNDSSGSSSKSHPTPHPTPKPSPTATRIPTPTPSPTPTSSAGSGCYWYYWYWYCGGQGGGGQGGGGRGGGGWGGGHR